MAKAIRVILGLALLIALPVSAADVVLKSEDDKMIYLIGVVTARNLGVYEFNESELEILKAGITDASLSRPLKMPIQIDHAKSNDFLQKRKKLGAELEKKASEEFLKKAAAEENMTVKKSGLLYKEITPGKGAHPSDIGTFKVKYSGMLRDGSVFDSTDPPKSPVTYNMTQVIPCWNEALRLMAVGGKSKFVCPPDLAYGKNGNPPLIKPWAALVFEAELLEVVTPQTQ
jgi:FKBP-type peptidyl-prolyl cis-trans isomerase FkpA/FKBP-type peptidyl-prolyl cis-trans isomerase FklB